MPQTRSRNHNMRQGSAKGIFANGAGCDRCRGLEPIGEDSIEVSFGSIDKNASEGCGGCWVLSEAVQKCCPSFVNLNYHNVVIKVRRPMLRDFVEVVVSDPERGHTVTLDLFSEPGALCYVGSKSIANVPTRSTMRLEKCAHWRSYSWRCDV